MTRTHESDEAARTHARPGADTRPRPGTRDILEGMARDRDRTWDALLLKLDSKLRILLHFRIPDSVRATCDEDDLLQEVWAEALRCFDRFAYRGEGSLQRWLAGILDNKLLHAGRAAPRVPLTVSSLAPAARCAPADTSPGLLDALERSQSGVSRAVWRRELEAKVQHVLAKLPASEREAVLLKLYEGLSGREAAARAGVDESTISVRFKRALATCSVHLREYAP